MCAATQLQTRKLLGLPEMIKVSKAAKRRKTEKNDEMIGDDCIFGLIGDEIIIDDDTTSPNDKSAKVSKKNATKVSVKSKKKDGQAEKGPKSKNVAPLLALKKPNKRELMHEKAQKKLDK